VSEQRHDELVDAMRTAWESLRIGDPLDPQTRIGPLINRAAVERTEGFVARARAEGGHVVTGGARVAGDGLFYPPTIVCGLEPDADLVRNEVFGPVTVVQSYRDLDEAVALANGTDYGLAASVYTTDRANALDLAGRITAGSVAVNTFGPSVTAPFGGRKGSGWGRESGPEGIHEFTELKQIVIGPGVGT
jgi:acyl-CoA reductase-like NAD-dependent aldehyde dehydrogenase